MARLVIFPYNLGSQGARELQQAVGGNTLRVRADGAYHPRPTDVIMNWGNSRPPVWWREYGWQQFLNPPSAVGHATNKLRTLETLQRVGVPVPTFTTDRTTAIAWRDAGHVVVARTILNGSEGRGIILVKEGEDMPNAPLYTKHLRHKKEYRVHVFQNTVIDVAEKRRRADFQGERNSLVRSHANGYIFAHEGVSAAPAVGVAALNAVQSLGLDFGAVDVGYREREGVAYVFEVNTAPGLENTQTIRAYAIHLRSLLQGTPDRTPGVVRSVRGAQEVPQQVQRVERRVAERRGGITTDRRAGNRRV